MQSTTLQMHLQLATNFINNPRARVACIGNFTTQMVDFANRAPKISRVIDVCEAGKSSRVVTTARGKRAVIRQFRWQYVNMPILADVLNVHSHSGYMRGGYRFSNNYMHCGYMNFELQNYSHCECIQDGYAFFRGSLSTTYKLDMAFCVNRIGQNA